MSSANPTSNEELNRVGISQILHAMLNLSGSQFESRKADACRAKHYYSGRRRRRRSIGLLMESTDSNHGRLSQRRKEGGGMRV
jgi:hypothetical protein